MTSRTDRDVARSLRLAALGLALSAGIALAVGHSGPSQADVDTMPAANCCHAALAFAPTLA